MGNVRGKYILPSSKALEAACADLRFEVEHQGSQSPIVLLGATYRATDPTAIKTVKLDGIEVGYQLKDLGGAYMMRCIYVKVLGHRWSEVPKADQDKILSSVFDGMLDQQANVNIELIAADCYFITQRFQIVYRVERSPDIVGTPTGITLDKDGKIVQ